MKIEFKASNVFPVFSFSNPILLTRISVRNQPFCFPTFGKPFTKDLQV